MNEKYTSRKAMFSQIDSVIRSTEEDYQKMIKLLHNVKLFLSDTPLLDVERKADELYEQIKVKRKVASVNIGGLYDRNSAKRLFTVLVQRHPDVQTREVQRRGDRKKIIEAWIGEEPAATEVPDLNDKASPEDKIRKLAEDYVSKARIARVLGLDLEDAQTLISRLVQENKIMQHPTEDGKFRWTGG